MTDYEPDTDEDATQEEAELEIGLDQFDIVKHDCVVTLVLPPTAKHPGSRHRTFKISTVREGKGQDPTKGGLAGKRIVALLTGPDNTRDYEGFAFVTEDGEVKVWKRLRSETRELSRWEKFADLLAHPAHWAAIGVTYQFSLRCRRCGRALTVPESISSGIGPICAGK
jgi:hypothetical protein